MLQCSMKLLTYLKLTFLLPCGLATVAGHAMAPDRLLSA